ncbi:hypothetical protein [Lysobacter gummosus]|uniref:hypothetical protein n=1 Tax=Lysobacter gummosus TaxID=262324 RepID=UPI00362BF067
MRICVRNVAGNFFKSRARCRHAEPLSSNGTVCILALRLAPHPATTHVNASSMRSIRICSTAP